MESESQVRVDPLPVRTWVIERLKRWSLYGTLGAMAVVTLVVLFYHPGPTAPRMQPPVGPFPVVGVEPPPSPTLTLLPPPTRTPIPLPPEIAILAGHWSGDNPPPGVVPDTGAVCEDGLREVDVNKGVAEKVVALLRTGGFRVDLLQEFDDRLKRDHPDYAPQVFLAIHSDSCVHGPDYPLATGYKIAHAEPSDVPVADDRLVACLRRDYDAQVQSYNLGFNENSITRDMTEYHAFREIVKTTPAAIIELGFLYNDRQVLTGHQAQLAQGLANGLMAFLKNDRCGLQ
ncbi:MAG: N-acetylmuramoyl-L-alanine amidase [Anaerolineae bacterium]